MKSGNAWKKVENPVKKRKRDAGTNEVMHAEKTIENLLVSVEDKKEKIQSEILPRLVHEYDAVKTTYDQLPNQRMHYRKKKQLMQTMKKLKHSIDKIQSGEEIQQFESIVAPFIKEYQKNSNEEHPLANTHSSVKSHTQTTADSHKKINRRKTTKHSRRIRVSVPNQDSRINLDQLEEELEDDTYVPPVYVATNNLCKECNGILRKIPTHSCMACENCGTSINYLDSTTASAGHDDRSYPQFSYKKLNHFTQWIKSTQGKEICNISDDVLQSVMETMYMYGIEPEKSTPKKVRECLKQCGLRKYYENCTLIWSMLTGKDPPRFTPKVEEKLETMFLQIQAPFEKAIQEVAPTRKNFLSYAYVCFKFCQIIEDFTDAERKKWLDSFSLLKGRDKLHRQDCIWKNICKQLSWPFIPSV